jgi:phosphotransferase system HPr (HPr) family protein
MTAAGEHSAQVIISNPLGFHVRPVQRFAELARMFKSDVQVQIRDRAVPGKSIMNLMSLGGRCGDKLTITARGEDARQSVGVLEFLAANSFFVEDNLDGSEQPLRHVARLAGMASCFNSRIRAAWKSKTADAKEFDSLRSLGLTATSEPQLQIEGDDAQQAQAVLTHLISHCFFVEEELAHRKDRSS